MSGVTAGEKLPCAGDVAAREAKVDAGGNERFEKHALGSLHVCRDFDHLEILSESIERQPARCFRTAVRAILGEILRNEHEAPPFSLETREELDLRGVDVRLESQTTHGVPTDDAGRHRHAVMPYDL